MTNIFITLLSLTLSSCWNRYNREDKDAIYSNQPNDFLMNEDELKRILSRIIDNRENNTLYLDLSTPSELNSLLAKNEVDKSTKSSTTPENALKIESAVNNLMARLEEDLKKRIAVVEKLLNNKNIRLNILDSPSNTLLLLASKFGYILLTKHLLNQMNKNSIDSKADLLGRALLLASENKHLEIAKELLKYRINLNIVNPNGDTALILAIKAGNAGLVSALLAKGDNEQLKRTLTWSNSNSKAMLKILVNKIDFNNVEIFKGFLDLAIKQRLFNALPYLIQKIEADSIDIFKDRVIDIFKLGNLGIVELIVEKMKESSEDVKEENIRILETALINASIKGHLEIIQLIINLTNKNITDKNVSDKKENISLKVNLNVTDEEGKTALIHAAINNQLRGVRILLRQNIDIEHRDNRGKTASIYAKENRNEKIEMDIIKATAFKKRVMEYLEKKQN